MGEGCGLQGREFCKAHVKFAAKSLAGVEQGDDDPPCVTGDGGRQVDDVAAKAP